MGESSLWCDVLHDAGLNNSDELWDIDEYQAGISSSSNKKDDELDSYWKFSADSHYGKWLWVIAGEEKERKKHEFARSYKHVQRINWYMI